MSERRFMAAFFSEIRLTVSQLPDRVERMAQFPDLGLRGMLFGKSTPFCETLPPQEREVKTAKIWMMQDAYRCRYILTDVPGQPRMLLGPYSTEEMTLTDITRLYQKRGLPRVDTDRLRQYYLSLPRLWDESFLDAMIHAHCSTSYGSQGYEIGYWKMEAESLPAPAQSALTDTEYMRRAMEQRYAAERRMMEFITQGNYYGAAQAKAKLALRNKDTRTGNTLRDAKNYTIIFNTLCRVAAGQGGVPPLAIDRCSSRFALEVEASGSMAEIRAIRERMLREYCELVRTHTPERYSPLVAQAVNILCADYAEAITLASVAETLNISANYLSTLFKRETGSSFTDFLTERRMETARELLTQTDQPVGEIALACGIADQNYFSRLFKAREGVTPGKYRSRARG